jgi:hypothetical protein
MDERQVAHVLLSIAAVGKIGQEQGAGRDLPDRLAGPGAVRIHRSPLRQGAGEQHTIQLLSGIRYQGRSATGACSLARSGGSVADHTEICYCWAVTPASFSDFHLAKGVSDGSTCCDNAAADTTSHRHLLFPLFSAVRRCPPYNSDPQMYAPGNCVPWMRVRATSCCFAHGTFEKTVAARCISGGSATEECHYDHRISTYAATRGTSAA